MWVKFHEKSALSACEVAWKAKNSMKSSLSMFFLCEKSFKSFLDGNWMENCRCIFYIQLRWALWMYVAKTFALESLTRKEGKFSSRRIFSSQARTTNWKLKNLSEKINLKWKLLQFRKYKSQDLDKQKKFTTDSTNTKRKKKNQ